MGCEGGGDGIRTTPPQERHEDDLPSVALTTKFLALCRQYGSEHLAVGIVGAGRGTGVPGLPRSNHWTAWNADRIARRPSACSTSWTSGPRGAEPVFSVGIGRKNAISTPEYKPRDAVLRRPNPDAGQMQLAETVGLLTYFDRSIDS